MIQALQLGQHAIQAEAATGSPEQTPCLPEKPSTALQDIAFSELLNRLSIREPVPALGALCNPQQVVLEWNGTRYLLPLKAGISPADKDLVAGHISTRNVVIERVLTKDGKLEAFSLEWSGLLFRAGLLARVRFENSHPAPEGIWRDGKLLEHEVGGQLVSALTVDDMPYLLQRFADTSRPMPPLGTPLATGETVVEFKGQRFFITRDRGTVRSLDGRLFKTLAAQCTFDVEQRLGTYGNLMFFRFQWNGGSKTRGNLMARVQFTQGQPCPVAIFNQEGRQIEKADGAGGLATCENLSAAPAVLSRLSIPNRPAPTIEMPLARGEAVVEFQGERYLIPLHDRVTRSTDGCLAATLLRQGDVTVERIIPQGGQCSVLTLFALAPARFEGCKVRIEFLAGKPQSVAVWDGPRRVAESGADGITHVFNQELEPILRDQKLPGRTAPPEGTPLANDEVVVVYRGERFLLPFTRTWNTSLAARELALKLRTRDDVYFERPVSEMGRVCAYQMVWHGGPSTAGLIVRFHAGGGRLKPVAAWRDGKPVPTLEFSTYLMSADQEGSNKPQSRSPFGSDHGALVRRYFEILDTADNLAQGRARFEQYAIGAVSEHQGALHWEKGETFQRLVLLQLLRQGRVVVPEIFLRAEDGVVFPDFYLPEESLLADAKYGNDATGIAATVGRYSRLLSRQHHKLCFSSLEVHHLEGGYRSTSTDLRFKKIGDESEQDETVRKLALSLRRASSSATALSELTSLRAVLDEMIAKRLGITDEGQYSTLNRESWAKAANVTFNEHEDRIIADFLDGRASTKPHVALPMEDYCYDINTDSFRPKHGYLPRDFKNLIFTPEATNYRSQINALYRQIRACRNGSRSDREFLELSDSLLRTIESVPSDAMRSRGLRARATILLQRTLEVVALRDDEILSRQTVNKTLDRTLARFTELLSGIPRNGRSGNEDTASDVYDRLRALAERLTAST
jgi:hypothetical protein